MSTPVQFPYQVRPNGWGPQDLAPLVPVRLERGGTSLDVVALVDSGAAFSVLPYDVGAVFGLSWHSLQHPIRIGGAGGSAAGKLLPVQVTIGSLPPTTMVFAWVSARDYPLVLGQVEFFQHFDVCFFRSRGVFQIQPRTP